MAIDFISSKDTDEERVIHSKSDNTEVTNYDGINEVIEELLESLLSGYQIAWRISNRKNNKR